MNIDQVITNKLSGGELTGQELGLVAEAAATDRLSATQAAAFQAAVMAGGMGQSETLGLTSALMDSGPRLESTTFGNKVDKCSTGGVGDKTSIILAPLMTAMGIAVPMISSRTLGYTGGTPEKLETIKGLKTGLGESEMLEGLKSIGMFITSPSALPADRLLRAIMEGAGTIESIPVMAACIMARKLSEGLDGLLVDVKTGSGAFMKEIAQARELASMMVVIGRENGVQTVAAITDMDQPLGRTVGTALELKECISALRGKWAEDLKTVTLSLGAWMLNINDAIGAETKVVALNKFGRKNYIRECMEFIEKGDAFKKFAEFVDYQGGDPDMVFNPSLIPTASHVQEITAGEQGYIRELGAEGVGIAAKVLGGGSPDPDPTAGIIMIKKTGDKTEPGDVIAMMHTNDPGTFAAAEEAYRSGLLIARMDKAPTILIHDSVL